MTIHAYTFAPFPPINGMPSRPLDRRARPRQPETELLLTRRAPPLKRARGRRRPMLALAGVAAATLVAPAAFWLGSGDAGATAEAAIPVPADLIAATRGEQGAMQVEGREAQAINAALPFAAGAIEAARPFSLETAAASAQAQTRALHCLTQAVYYEAGYEPIEGRRAVAQVILNRMRHPAYPNSVCGVVYDGSSRPGCQFSFTCDGSLRRAPASGAWAQAEQIAREALGGAVVTSVGTATHYHANYVAPYWAPRLTKLAQIGAHIFYRWPGAAGRTAAFTSRYAGLEGVYNPLSAMPVATAAMAGGPILAVDPTDRRAPEDVGGRLDVTKGWTLSIPTPAESRGAYATALGRQGQEEQRAAAAAPAPPSIGGTQ